MTAKPSANATIATLLETACGVGSSVLVTVDGAPMNCLAKETPCDR
jgi:hypothetical protein